MKEADAEGADETFVSALAPFKELPDSVTREDIQALLDSLTAKWKSFQTAQDIKNSDVVASHLIEEAAKDLRLMLSDIPEGALAVDIAQIVNQMAADLAMPPVQALASVKSVLDLIRKQDNVRCFVISSGSNQEDIISSLERIVKRLGSETSERQIYGRSPRVIRRMQERLGTTVTPLFVGLVNENTRSGVHINTANCASFEDADRDHLLKFLSARLYGGGGAHSMFMKTWGAGLAYSNGLRSNESTGRLIYYAERCPDLSQTMQFVVDQLNNAPFDPSLADYAVSQGFAVSRAGATYETRGEEMAADLADGLTPEVVHAFRSGLLALRNTEPDLYKILHELMPETYGMVLPGYGIRAEQSAGDSDARYFVIGPEKQLQSYQEYLNEVEAGAHLYRLYPRDFWLVN